MIKINLIHFCLRLVTIDTLQQIGPFTIHFTKPVDVLSSAYVIELRRVDHVYGQKCSILEHHTGIYTILHHWVHDGQTRLKRSKLRGTIKQGSGHYRACRKAPHLKKIASSQIYSSMSPKQNKKVYLYECNMLLLLLGGLFN